MPTETKFICVSGATNVDLSGIFEDLNGGTSYGNPTNFKVGANDINTLFHASTGGDVASFDTGFKVNGTDLSAIFRRRGFVGITITTQPTNQVVTNNASATFSIAATAAGTPTYQWYKNNSIISGATSTTYTTGALTTANDTDTYFCKVSYSGSSVDSNSVNTRIKPYIITNPSGGSFNENDGMSLSVVAGGSPTLSYQWYKNGNIISGAISSSYPASGQFSLTTSTVGTYTCKVTSTHDATGVTSSGAVLSIIPPVVTISAGQLVFNNTDLVIFSSSLSQGTNVTYQWYGPSGLISGATGSSYSFNMSSSTYGTYYVRATNNGGYDDSNTITVYMNPLITSNPSNYGPVCPGANATFTVTAVGSPILSYAWYKNGSTYVGGGSTLNYSGGSNGDTFACTVSSNATAGMSTATSSNATLSTYALPVITTDPASLSTNESPGNYAALQVYAASNSQTLYFTWQKWNGSSWVNENSARTGNMSATSDQYVFEMIADYNGDYRCVVSNSCGTDVSATATIDLY